ncbi:MAG: adenylate/guanylate cyclase domain-containing protein [Bryobacteraceae bacterium]
MAALILCAASLRAEISPESGSFFFKQYLPDDYGADAQNWAVVQDARGVMFFGNTEGLLEYDGARWTHIPLAKRGSLVRSLAVDVNGTVYVGGQNDFGFLKEDGSGILRYVSLLDKVAASDRSFGDIWTISCTRSGVFFSSYYRIFRWSPQNGMTTWKPKTRFGRVFTVDDLPYVVVSGSGLHRIGGGYLELVPGSSERLATGDKLELVPGGEQIQKQINAAFSFAGSLMVATSTGLFRQQGDRFVPFSTDAADLLKKAHIYVCAPLSNGDLAVGTIQSGLVLLTSEGHIHKIVNKESGLASNYVNAIYNDRAGSVWLALNLGIAHIETELPITRFGDREGVDETVPAIQRYRGALYAGTVSGLAKLIPGADAHFEPVSEISGEVLSLLSSPDGLLIASQYGIADLSPNGLAHIIPGEGAMFSLSTSIHDPRVYYAAGRHGLFLLRSDGGSWKKMRQVPSGNQDFLSAVEDADGRVWATTPRSILRIDLRTDPAKIQRFAVEEGGLAAWNYAYRIGGKVVFATGKGLRRFDNAKERLVPENRFGDMFADGSHDVSKIVESPTGNIWISGRSYNGVLRKTRNDSYAWDQYPLARAGIKELWGLYVDEDNVAWASGADGGLVRYTASNSSRSGTDFQALVSSVQLLRSANPIGDANAATKLPHHQNSLRFDYAAPVFEDESRTEYQVRLDGLDHGWSEWSKETRKEYTNLWEGRYAFKVRGRDLHGRISRETAFAFRVLPPWYRTWWAYVLYAPLLLGSMALVVKWRIHALSERNRKLEEIIENRTVEIRQQRDEIKREEERTEALLLNILPAPVADELRATGKVKPTTYDEITVCFTDFVGFTLSSEKISAEDLVDGLHKYFTAFDEIVERYGLEKLKTIGDSYMFVGGLPDEKRSHAVDVVIAAFEMLDVIKRFSTEYPHWNVRIGINSGPVVAGVVGVRKFAYDIWGQTVNFAARFQSSGSPNRINLSSRTYELVNEFIECEPRGHVRIKEGRQLEMYFAQQVRPELLGQNRDGVPERFAELYQQRFGQAPPAIPAAQSEARRPQAIASL